MSDEKWRVGRKVGRTIYRQIGAEPSDDDPLIGVMDSPELARRAVGSNDEFREMANNPTHPGNKEYVAANLLALLDALRPHGFDTGDWFGQLWMWAKRSKGDQRPNTDFADKLPGRCNQCGRAQDEYEAIESRARQAERRASELEEALARARVER